MDNKMVTLSALMVIFLVAQSTAFILDNEKLVEFNRTKNWDILRSYLVPALKNNSIEAHDQAQGIPSTEYEPMYRIGREGYNALADELAIAKSGADLVDSSGRAMLHGATLGLKVGTARLLLARGADIQARDSHGNTALILAARVGSFPLVQYLARRGADLNSADDQGRTALHWALANHDWAMAEWLDDHGALLPPGRMLLESAREAEVVM
ncbi:ankyrin repeat domain-containing protein 1-like [Bacillus rossius redtenbacheri]|uniref:ankyrin repeat domain-containing protein 1-like n=1 Tax=Bacillus rossius redtenbacheri TaxID=93214 RepID=UPI002FDEEA82